MRHEKPILTLKEFAAEIGRHPYTVANCIIKKGKLRFIRDGLRGHYRIPREYADEYIKRHTFGGTAYGRTA